MVKFGIYRLEDYAPPAGGVVGRLRGMFTGNRVSYQLLRTPIPPAPHDIARFEAIMHTMRLPTNIYRTTKRGRFKDLDKFLDDRLGRRYSSAQELEIHDWAASDCLTPVEWSALLFARFPQARLVASDMTLCLIELSLTDGTAFILDQTGEPLQYLRAPFVLRLNPPEPAFLPLNYLLARSGLAKFAQLQKQLNLQEWLSSGGEPLQKGTLTLRKISAVHPEAEALRAADPRFTISRHSVFEPLEHPVDAIRTMNILNLAYFPAERLKLGAQAVWSSLKEGGLWIVGRTFVDHPPAHNASLFERTAQGFQLLEHYGEGSEIANLALDLRPTQ